MKVKVDLSSSNPKIAGDYGTLEYSEHSNQLFIKSRRRGVVPIGSNDLIETDPVFTAWLATPPNISIFTNDAGYLTSFTELDPIFSLWQSTYDNHADWDTAYGWGNHASAGYLTSATAAITYQPIGSYLTSQTGAFGLTLSGTLTTGSKGYVILPYNATITKWYITSDVVGSIVVDVKKAGVSIIGAGNKPTLSAASNNSANIAGWTTSALVDGDVLEFNVDSVATVTKVTLTIKITI